MANGEFTYLMHLIMIVKTESLKVAKVRHGAYVGFFLKSRHPVKQT